MSGYEAILYFCLFDFNFFLNLKLSWTFLVWVFWFLTWGWLRLCNVGRVAHVAADCWLLHGFDAYICRLERAFKGEESHLFFSDLDKRNTFGCMNGLPQRKACFVIQTMVWHTDLRSPGRPCSKYIGEETIYIYIRNILFINSMIQYVPHVCMVCIVICWNQDAKLTTWQTESGKPTGSHIWAKDSLFLRKGGTMPMWTNVSLWTHVILLSFAKWAFLNLWAIQKAKIRMHSICPYHM